MSLQATEADGRRVRRDRNRDAVVDALLELFREGNLRPGAADVAARSGVSLRSVFRYFDDLDELARTAIARHTERVAPLLELPDVGKGPFDVRVERLVEHRLQVYEAVAPVARAALDRAPVNAVVARGVADRRARLRRQVERQFAPELRRMRPEQRLAAAAAADVLCSFESLEQLRRHRRLSARRTAAVLSAALTALLAPQGGRR